MLSRRAVFINYDQTKLDFKSTDEEEEFHKVLGRLVAYNMSSNVQDAVEYVEVYVEYDRRMVAKHYYALMANADGRWTNDNLFCNGQRTLQSLQRGPRPFVLGARLRDGKYTFHS